MQGGNKPEKRAPAPLILAADAKFSVRLHSASLSTGGLRGFFFIYFRPAYLPIQKRTATLFRATVLLSIHKYC